MPEPRRKPEYFLQIAGQGATGFEVVAAVAQLNPEIQALDFVTYCEGPNWRDLSLPASEDQLPFQVRGLQQDKAQRVHTAFPRHELGAEKLQGFASRLAPHQLLGVTSKVQLSGGKPGHIPMMDFMCPPSPENQAAVTRLLREFQPAGGRLLESGKSYHYYGCRVLSDNEWYAFLGKCLLMSGYVDDRYIGHQLVDGHCVLRLSASKLKPKIPIVIAEV
jgi:hypothetical protein